MKILYFEWPSFGNEDIKNALFELGHDVMCMAYSSDDVYHDEGLEKKIMEKISGGAVEAAFSSNYFVPIAIACHETGIPYISWIYDSPFSRLYSYTTIFETNHIFVFDKEQYGEFAENRINTVHYMPLASNPKRLQKVIGDDRLRRSFLNSSACNNADIAFVGSMYNEDHTFFRRLHNISDHTRGYLEGLIAVQSRIYGYNFVQSMMNEKLMDDMSKDLPMGSGRDSVVRREYLFAEYAINREITARERMDYLTSVGQRFSKNDRPVVDLYTRDGNVRIKGVKNHGPVDHINIVPFIYNRSKINLNITLRSIHSGIPLRAFEILGSGGFLLTNYQADFADCYIDGEDYVSYNSKEDMLDKIEYYLSHDKERQEIAANGLRRTIEENMYVHRLDVMISTL